MAAMMDPVLLEQAALYVRRHFSRHMPAHMVFHDLEHTLQVTRGALAIGRAEGLSKEDLAAVELAALFHDTGYAVVYKGHEVESERLAEAFLRSKGCTLALVNKVRGLIRATRLGTRPRTPLQRVLCDADSAKAGQADFDARSELLRRELEVVTSKKLDKREWAGENLRYLEQHSFHTKYARDRYGAQKAINLDRLRERLQQPEIAHASAFHDPIISRPQLVGLQRTRSARRDTSASLSASSSSPSTPATSTSSTALCGLAQSPMKLGEMERSALQHHRRTRGRSTAALYSNGNSAPYCEVLLSHWSQRYPHL